MANIMDYIKWRGDLSFKQSEFNDVDNLILSRLSYFCLDGILEEHEKITIKQAYERTLKREIPPEKILQKEDIDLFPALAKSKRFGRLYITEFENKVELEQEKQFSAVTIIIPDNTIYVAYRGTDNTLVGWKEDFNMCFSEDVPSQHEAVNYLEKIAHLSKRKIIKTYNNDGPGMSKEITNTDKYKNTLNKIHTFVPQSSIIGRLLYHEEKYKVILSTQSGVMQHDLYSWQVEGKDFVCLKQVTNQSQITDKVRKGWLNGVAPERRQEFIDALYQIFISTDVQTLHEFSNNWLKNARICLKTYSSTDEENKKILSQTLLELINITKDNLIDSMQKATNKKTKKIR